jgi:hypothetical protein
MVSGCVHATTGETSTKTSHTMSIMILTQTAQTTPTKSNQHHLNTMPLTQSKMIERNEPHHSFFG